MHGLNFHYTIQEDPMLGIGYCDVRRIPCICSDYLRKLASPWNTVEDN